MDTTATPKPTSPTSAITVDIYAVTNQPRIAITDAPSDAAEPGEWFVDQGNAMSRAERRLLENAFRYVAANPLKAVAIALAAGIVFGRAR